MIPLTITTNLDIDPWNDLDPAKLNELCPAGQSATVDRIGVLPAGTQQGRACVEFLVTLPDGRQVIAETTLRIFRVASAAVLATPVAQMESL